MVKCDNCDKDATYTTADPGVNPAHYCPACLPVWLRTRASVGHFPLLTQEEELETSAKPKKKKPKVDE